jgi:transcriptional regulator with XRE-family HTH domain
MLTLKEIRSQLGVNQAEVARKINVSVPAYSTYENGQAVPCVEDMLILEREFGQKIEWNDTINSEDKARIMHSLTILSESYPLSAVLIFAQKYLKEGVKIGRPGPFINFFAEASKELNIEPLEPTGLKFKNK